MQVKKNESGSIMVEVIAVLALLGVMGTVMFRQIQRRNEELDNINMASEIRMVKEATTAYIQANKATLEANCTLDEHGYGEQTISHDSVDRFMPDNWACAPGSQDCIVYDYQIYLSCYRVDSALAGNRLGMYGIIIPNAGNSGPMPTNFNLKRAARVATLIGSDGGIHESGEANLQGTMGAWEVDCPAAADCEHRDDDFFVATTGMDIYIPETENNADNTVDVPHNIAFERLHSTDYFSVGGGGNCVRMEGGQFLHETLDPATGRASDDDIRNVGVGNPACDPLFWVGSTGDATHDHSEAGQAYVRNSLYVGRDNAHDRQAIALRRGAGASPTARDNNVVVYDETGNERLTLNGAGEIIGRTDTASGRGYRIDDDGVTLFEETTDPTTNERVQVTKMKLTRDGLETNVIARFYNGDTLVDDQVYAVRPAETSIMNDIRLTTRGGAKLSEILPNYIAKNVTTITQDSATLPTVVKPQDCPRGYLRAIAVTPTRYSQYVTGADLNVNLTGETNTGTATSGHKHSVTITGRVDNPATSVNETAGNLVVNGQSGGAQNTTLTLRQLPPVQVTIDGSNDTQWSVGFSYGNVNVSGDHPVTAVVQTYCVFDPDNFENNTAVNENANGVAKERGATPGIIQDGQRTCAGSIDNNQDCLTGEKCINGRCVRLFDKCNEPDGTPLGNNIYCQNNRRVYWQCKENTDCSNGQTCDSSHNCVD